MVGIEGVVVFVVEYYAALGRAEWGVGVWTVFDLTNRQRAD